MSHPYLDLPTRAFWRTAVAEADRAQFPGLYQPCVAIDRKTRVATAGSCFAQHIGNYLRLAGCRVLDCEPAPKGMDPTVARRFGYGIYSGRYGNVYTARQLLQLLRDVAAQSTDATEVWEKDGRFYDALRPTVEPEGCGSLDEVLALRRAHLAQVGKMLPRTDVFIFTLGLTETWEDTRTGRVYPVCPGVAAGQFDSAHHRFRNFTSAEVLADLHAVKSLLQGFNPAIEMLLTISPVPLTATASGDHVLCATTYSKSALRAAAGDFVASTDDTDYFPSYEVIMAPASGQWFLPNMRSVAPEGVEKVMGIFLTAQGLLGEAPPPEAAPQDDDTDPDAADDLVCDELLLQAFSK